MPTATAATSPVAWMVAGLDGDAETWADGTTDGDADVRLAAADGEADGVTAGANGLAGAEATGGGSREDPARIATRAATARTATSNVATRRTRPAVLAGDCARRLATGR